MDVGYRVLLPNGAYSVVLHFAEARLKGKGQRRFDVTVEGRLVLEDFEPLEKGYGVAWQTSLDVQVRDGFLDIAFAARPLIDGRSRRFSRSTIAAIEIERRERE